MDHEFSHRLLTASVRLRELMMLPPVQMDDREAYMLSELLSRAAHEIAVVEDLRKQISSLKRALKKGE